MAFSGVLTATVLVAFSMTLLMGLYAKLPFGVAPGMGINAFFTFSLILGHQIPWPIALGMVFWAGVLFVVISITPVRVAIFFTDLFDSLSTFIGVSEATGMVDEKGDPIRLKEGLLVDAFATLGAGLFGTSSGTAFIESASGIEAGGRSGRSAVITALCFLPCFFIAPFVGMVPAFATAPVLVLVGALMFRSVSSLKLDKLEDVIPVFLTIVLIPLTFSITQGILWGFISHVALYTLFCRAREVHPVMWAISAVSVGLITLEQMTGF